MMISFTRMSMRPFAPNVTVLNGDDMMSQLVGKMLDGVRIDELRVALDDEAKLNKLYA